MDQALSNLTLNYLIVKHCRGSWFSPVLTWTFNGLVLFINDLYHWYQFSSLGSSWSYLVSPRPCISNAKLIFLFFYGRMASQACILVGILYLILRCFDSSRLIWITIGHAKIKKVEVCTFLISCVISSSWQRMVSLICGNRRRNSVWLSPMALNIILP